MTAIMAGTLTPERDTRPTTHFYDRALRHCATPGCITILCRYNPGPDCYAHTQAPPPEPDGPKGL